MPISHNQKPLQRLLVVDGNSIFSRSYYALALRLAPWKKCRRENFALGPFLSTLATACRAQNCDGLIICFDRPERILRKWISPLYKTGRRGQKIKYRDSFHEQFLVLKQLLRLLGVPYVEAPTFEADDCVATLCQLAKTLEIPEVLVFSSDRDLSQLLDEGVHLLVPNQTDPVTVASFTADQGFPPSAFLTYRALTGDSSDRIMGVPHFGPKRSQSLLSKYSTLNEIFSHLSEAKLSKACQNALETYQDVAYFARFMTQLYPSVPLFGPEDHFSQNSDQVGNPIDDQPQDQLPYQSQDQLQDCTQTDDLSQTFTQACREGREALESLSPAGVASGPSLSLPASGESLRSPSPRLRGVPQPFFSLYAACHDLAFLPGASIPAGEPGLSPSSPSPTPPRSLRFVSAEDPSVRDLFQGEVFLKIYPSDETSPMDLLGLYAPSYVTLGQATEAFFQAFQGKKELIPLVSDPYSLSFCQDQGWPVQDLFEYLDKISPHYRSFSVKDLYELFCADYVRWGTDPRLDTLPLTYGNALVSLQADSSNFQDLSIKKGEGAENLPSLSERNIWEIIQDLTQTGGQSLSLFRRLQVECFELFYPHHNVKALGKP